MLFYKMCFIKKYLFFPILALSLLLNINHVYAQKKRIPIMASHTVWVGHNKYENYKNIEDAGFTLAKEYYPSVEVAIQHLKTASKTKVKFIIECPELSKDINNTVKRLRDIKSFAGYDIYDEPNTEMFDELGEIVKEIKAIDDKHYIWVNLYPITVSTSWLKASSYEEYVNLFIEKVNPPFVSFDIYPIRKTQVAPEYYQNLDIVSRNCKKAGIPFWGYVSASQWNYFAEPTKGTMAFQAYNNLAYGAQGIEYFSYRRIVQKELNITVSPIDTNYQKMPIYYDVKKLNSEINYYSKFFYGCDVKEVSYLSEKTPVGTRPTDSLPYDIKVCNYSGIGFVVSYFVCKGHDYLLFVNQDYVEPQKIEIVTPRTLRRMSYYRNERRKVSGKKTLEAQPGSIILLRLS